MVNEHTCMYRWSWKAFFRWLLAVLFVVAGIKHFQNPDFYRRIVPPSFPLPAVLVAVSGFFEIVGGLGLLVPRLRRIAAWGLIALLVAVFPANIYMALHPEVSADLHIATWLLWVRLPLQFAAIAWVWLVALKRPDSAVGWPGTNRSGVVASVVAAIALLSAGGCSRFDLLNTTVPFTGYGRTNDLSYGDLPRQKLDVYVPCDVEPNARVVVFFYGGDWQTGGKADYRFVAQAITSRGFIAVMPDYRLYPEVTFPDFVEDGALAVRWVHDNAARLGGDPSRIYLMGHSAGAHIAALLALDESYLRRVGLDQRAIRAVAALSGPYDFVPTVDDKAAFNMGRADTVVDPRIEPIHFVDGKGAPMLLIHGLKDETVKPENAVKLAKRIEERGGEVTSVYYPSRAHVGVVLSLAWPFRWLAPTLDDVTAFFRAH